MCEQWFIVCFTSNKDKASSVNDLILNPFILSPGGSSVLVSVGSAAGKTLHYRLRLQEVRHPPLLYNFWNLLENTMSVQNCKSGQNSCVFFPVLTLITLVHNEHCLVFTIKQHKMFSIFRKCEQQNITFYKSALSYVQMWFEIAPWTFR